MSYTDISPDKKIFLGQLFLSHDMSESYKAVLSDKKPPPKHVATTPLPLSITNLSFDKSTQFFVTDSSILRNTYIKLRFTSSDLMVKFLKLLKTFATSDMDNCKEISSGNSINYNELTKIYAHSSGGCNIQTTPTDFCKDDGA